MTGSEVDVLEIRKARDGDLAALARGIRVPSADQHRMRLAEQAGGSITYLVAWLGEQPAGYGLIRWVGPREPAIADALAGCPEIFSLEVLERLRGRGIGTRLLASLEGEARERGFSRVGLGVALENEAARRLYLRLGYRRSGLPEYIDRWVWLDEAGQPHQEADPCEFLVKDLFSPG